MPLTKFQSEVLAVIVGNRSEESHFAGGLVLNASDESARFSNDFDMFHDAILNENGDPGWIGEDPTLRIHHGSLRGCWPVFGSLES